MNLIDKQLAKIKQENKLGLMTHLVVGYPSLEVTESLLKVMKDAGVDFIELQIPFSDPLADGPTIMRACERALENGVKVVDAFELASRSSREINIPLLFMAYYNTVFKYGVQRFCQDAKKAGMSGLIVPDMPLEEEHEEHFIKYCQEAGLKNIRIISPASTGNRLKKNAQIADGFIYCTARQGITDAQKALDPQVESYLRDVRQQFSIPVAVGFGISSKKRVDMIRPYTDIVVVGSALIELINRTKKENIEQEVTRFLEALGV